MKRVILAVAICRVKVTRMPMSRRTMLAVICCLVLQEVVLLLQYGQVQAPFYPGGYDQVDYLMALARIGTQDSAEGLLAGTMAQGWLLHILAWPLLWLDLPPVLAVHLPLLVLEMCLFLVARQRGAAMGWFALGLFFSVRAHEAVYGGPPDYRHDYLSLILFGATALATYRAVPFRRLGPVLLAGLLGGLAVHARFVVSAYLVAAVPWLLVAALLGTKTNFERRSAVFNLTLAFALAALVALPFYLVNRTAIHAYYLDGHLLSTAEATARGFGDAGFVDFLSYYLRNLVRGQLGATFAVLAGMAMTVGFFRRFRMETGPAWPRLLTVAGFLMPLVVLSLGLQRSQVVALVMVIPAILGVAALAEPMASMGRSGARVLTTLGLVGIATLPIQVLLEARQVHEERSADRHDLALAGMERLARALPDRPLVISVLGLHEALSASMLRLLRTRENGLWGPPLIGRLGHTIFSLPEHELLAELHSSDLVLVPEGIRLPPNPLPSQLQLHEERTRLTEMLKQGWDRRPELDFPLEEGFVRIWSRF